MLARLRRQAEEEDLAERIELRNLPPRPAQSYRVFRDAEAYRDIVDDGAYLPPVVDENVFSTYLERLRQASPLLLRLLAAYWNYVKNHSRGRKFFEDLLGSAVPGLDLSKDEDLERALVYVRRTGFPRSAWATFFTFTGFFGRICVSVGEFTVAKEEWKEKTIALMVQYGDHSILIPKNEKHETVLTWETLIEFKGIQVIDGDYTITLVPEKVTHRVSQYNYEIDITCTHGYKERTTPSLCSLLTLRNLVPCLPLRYSLLESFPEVSVTIKIEWKSADRYASNIELGLQRLRQYTMTLYAPDP